MSILFSRQCEYALQAVMYMALKGEDRTITIKELTEQLDIPFHFLAKILQDLGRKGLLKSRKGPSGGFSLGVSAEELTLLDVVEAIDGTGFQLSCALGFAECSKTDPCALHDQWSYSRDSIVAMLKSNSIAQMAFRMQKQQYRRVRSQPRKPSP